MTVPRRASLLSRLAAPIALIACARAHVHTVGPAPSEFATLVEAVQSALDGDTLVVRSGTYTGIQLDGKGLAIVADEGAFVHLSSGVRVRNLGSQQSLVLAGLLITGLGAPALDADNVQGGLRVEGSTLRVWPDLSSAPIPAASLSACADAAFFDVTFQGGTPIATGATAGPGLRAASSRLALQGCLVQGAFGVPGTVGPPGAGGAGGIGLALVGGELCASECTIRGGPGGDGGVGDTGNPGCAAHWPFAGGSGGTGLAVSGGGLARLGTTHVEGGAAGSGASNACGYHALDGDVGARVLGPVEVLNAPARRLRAPSVAREGSDASLVLDGQPGERAFLFLSNGPGWLWSGAFGGVVLVKAPFQRRVLLGTVPASGRLTATLAIPDLGTGVESATRHLQAGFVDAVGRVRVGGAATLVLLDRAF